MAAGSTTRTTTSGAQAAPGKGSPAPFASPGGPGGDGLGVVLVHGFTSSPWEVRPIGDRLAAAGIAVDAPLLPGHGTSVADLAATRWQAWADAVEGAFEGLRARCDRVALVGQSLGGLLSLYVASRRPDVAAVGSLAAPLWLEGMSARVARWTAPGALLHRVEVIPKLGGADVRDARAKAENPCYDAVPTRALGELVAFMGVVDAALPRVAAPVLVLHALHDHTAPVACAYRIAARARAHRLRLLPRSYHLIAVDVERALVADEVTAFVRAHARPRATAPAV